MDELVSRTVLKRAEKRIDSTAKLVGGVRSAIDRVESSGRTSSSPMLTSIPAVLLGSGTGGLTLVVSGISGRVGVIVIHSTRAQPDSWQNTSAPGLSLSEDVPNTYQNSVSNTQQFEDSRRIGRKLTMILKDLWYARVDSNHRPFAPEANALSS